jgi:hypothetical protein
MTEAQDFASALSTALGQIAGHAPAAPGAPIPKIRSVSRARPVVLLLARTALPG